MVGMDFDCFHAVFMIWFLNLPGHLLLIRPFLFGYDAECLVSWFCTSYSVVYFGERLVFIWNGLHYPVSSNATSGLLVITRNLKHSLVKLRLEPNIKTAVVVRIVLNFHKLIQPIIYAGCKTRKEEKKDWPCKETHAVQSPLCKCCAVLWQEEGAKFKLLNLFLSSQNL